MFIPFASRVVVACSGGPDSQALLHLLRRRKDLKLFACGVDHGLRSSQEVNGELDLASGLAHALGVPFSTLRINTVEEPPRGNRLAWAREVRYRALHAHRTRVGADFIAVGHHEDDNFETALMQMMRRAPPTGMSERSGALIRPLLRYPRAWLGAYLRTENISYAQDPSNHDGARWRTRLRSHVLPALWNDLLGTEVSKARTALSILIALERAAYTKKERRAKQELTQRLHIGGIDLRGLTSALADRDQQRDRRLLSSDTLEEILEQWVVALHQGRSTGDVVPRSNFGSALRTAPHEQELHDNRETFTALRTQGRHEKVISFAEPMFTSRAGSPRRARASGSRAGRRERVVQAILEDGGCITTVGRRPLKTFGAQGRQVLWMGGTDAQAFSPIALGDGRGVGSVRLVPLGVGLRWRWTAGGPIHDTRGGPVGRLHKPGSDTKGEGGPMFPKDEIAIAGLPGNTVAFLVHRLHFKPAHTKDIAERKSWIVRPWRSGDRLKMRSGHIKVGDLFTNLKIPVPLRKHWPVLEWGNEILWVLGLRKCPRALLEGSGSEDDPDFITLIVRFDGTLPWRWCY